MEWSFIVAAVQRRLRFVVLCATIGALPGLFSIASSDEVFEAVSVVSVVAPTTGSGAMAAATQPDRYIVSQLAVMTSVETYEAAATEIGGEIDAEAIGNLVEVEQEPNADLLNITATSPDAKQAAAIANAVATVYVRDASTRGVNARTPELDSLQKRLDDLLVEINAADARVKAALEPYLSSERGFPDPMAVAPADVGARNRLSAEYDRIAARKDDIELEASSQATSTVIEQASTPTSPKGSRGRLILLGGLLLGGVAGVAVALVLAQLSSKVLDDITVEELLGTPVVGNFPRAKALSGDYLAALYTGPPEIRDTMERLSVRAEAMADPEVEHALTIAVVGTQQGSATTTLTLALARRMAQAGYSVVIVDGDLRTQTISEVFDTTGATGIKGVLDAELRSSSSSADFFAGTDIERIDILGAGDISKSEALRRDSIGPILDAARERAQIVIFDGGALMSSALTLFASKAADVIILAVPLMDQDQENLAEVSENLPTERSRVLAVTTSPIRRRQRRSDEPEPELATA